MVTLSPAYSPAVLKGIKLDANNPFRFHFYVDVGDGSKPSPNGRVMNPLLRTESEKLIKYFLASLTIPEKDLWVNLSPYENDRIVPQAFGQTEMGRDLLAQDYILKQITASLIYPESQLGKEFWGKVYAQAQAKYGTTNIPINTFNKVWIIPDKAVVYENNGTAFVLENHLKVMLEQDYLSLQKHLEGDMSFPNASGPQAGHSQLFIGNLDPRLKHSGVTNISNFGSQILRQIIIPALTKEVNEGKNFAPLRQVFYSLILATWYKNKIKDSIINKIYSNKAKISGVIPLTSLRPSGSARYEDRGAEGDAVIFKGNANDTDIEYIYQQYLKAFKKGVYNYIKEEPLSSPNESQVLSSPNASVGDLSQGRISRKYFSGGCTAGGMTHLLVTESRAQITPNQISRLDSAQFVELDVKMKVRPFRVDAAMILNEPDYIMQAKISPEIIKMWEDARDRGIFPTWGRSLNPKLFFELSLYSKKVTIEKYGGLSSGNETRGDMQNPVNILDRILYRSIINMVEAYHAPEWKKEGALVMDYLKRRDNPMWEDSLLSFEEEDRIAELSYFIARFEEMAWMESALYYRSLGGEGVFPRNIFIQPLGDLFSNAFNFQRQQMATLDGRINMLVKENNGLLTLANLLIEQGTITPDEAKHLTLSVCPDAEMNVDIRRTRNHFDIKYSIFMKYMTEVVLDIPDFIRLLGQASLGNESGVSNAMNATEWQLKLRKNPFAGDEKMDSFNIPLQLENIDIASLPPWYQIGSLKAKSEQLTRIHNNGADELSDRTKKYLADFPNSSLDPEIFAEIRAFLVGWEKHHNPLTIHGKEITIDNKNYTNIMSILLDRQLWRMAKLDPSQGDGLALSQVYLSNSVEGLKAVGQKTFRVDDANFKRAIRGDDNLRRSYEKIGEAALRWMFYDYLYRGNFDPFIGGMGDNYEYWAGVLPYYQEQINEQVFGEEFSRRYALNEFAHRNMQEGNLSLKPKGLLNRFEHKDPQIKLKEIVDSFLVLLDDPRFKLTQWHINLIYESLSAAKAQDSQYPDLGKYAEDLWEGLRQKIIEKESIKDWLEKNVRTWPEALPNISALPPGVSLRTISKYLKDLIHPMDAFSSKEWPMLFKYTFSEDDARKYHLMGRNASWPSSENWGRWLSHTGRTSIGQIETEVDLIGFNLDKFKNTSGMDRKTVILSLAKHYVLLEKKWDEMIEISRIIQDFEMFIVNDQIKKDWPAGKGEYLPIRSVEKGPWLLYQVFEKHPDSGVHRLILKKVAHELDRLLPVVERTFKEFEKEVNDQMVNEPQWTAALAAARVKQQKSDNNVRSKLDVADRHTALGLLKEETKSNQWQAIEALPGILVNSKTGRIKFIGKGPLVPLRFNLWAERHGETQAVKEKRLQGRYKGPGDEINQLTELGRKGAIEAAQNLLKKGDIKELIVRQEPLVIITSELQRTKDTAASFKERFLAEGGYIEPLTVADDIITGANEISFGVAENKNADDLRGSPDEKILHAYRDGLNATVKFKDGESFIDLLIRAKKWLERLNELYPNRTVVLFGHGTFISAVRVLLGHEELEDESGQIDWRNKILAPSQVIHFSPNASAAMKVYKDEGQIKKTVEAWSREINQNPGKLRMLFKYSPEDSWQDNWKRLIDFRYEQLSEIGHLIYSEKETFGEYTKMEMYGYLNQLHGNNGLGKQADWFVFGNSLRDVKVKFSLNLKVTKESVDALNSFFGKYKDLCKAFKIGDPLVSGANAPTDRGDDVSLYFSREPNDQEWEALAVIVSEHMRGDVQIGQEIKLHGEILKGIKGSEIGLIDEEHVEQLDRKLAIIDDEKLIQSINDALTRLDDQGNVNGYRMSYRYYYAFKEALGKIGIKINYIPGQGFMLEFLEQLWQNKKENFAIDIPGYGVVFRKEIMPHLAGEIYPKLVEFGISESDFQGFVRKAARWGTVLQTSVEMRIVEIINEIFKSNGLLDAGYYNRGEEKRKLHVVPVQMGALQLALEMYHERSDAMRTLKPETHENHKFPHVVNAANRKPKDGGINLNPAQMSLQIKRGADDFKFNFNSPDINAAQVAGLTFSIDQMKRVANINQVLGLE